VEIAMVGLLSPISCIDLGFLHLGYTDETWNLAEFQIPARIDRRESIKFGVNLENIIFDNEKLKENNNEKNHHPDFSEPVVFELRPPGQYDRRRERKISSIKSAI
jgi:hypothetical protein